jgi:hypothetical protein
MNDIKPNPPPEIACHCSGTTKEKIKELVKTNLLTLMAFREKPGFVQDVVAVRACY